MPYCPRCRTVPFTYARSESLDYLSDAISRWMRERTEVERLEQRQRELEWLLMDQYNVGVSPDVHSDLKEEIAAIDTRLRRRDELIDALKQAQVVIEDYQRGR